MGPHNLISLTRWTIKSTLTSKNEEGKYISNWHKIIAVSFSKSSNYRRSMTLVYMALKKNHRRVMACLTLLGKMSRIATAKSCCIKTWQSWDFKPTNFIYFTCTRFLILEKHPYGTFTRCRHWQKIVFSFLTNYDMLKTNIFSYHQTLNVTGDVYPSQLDLYKYSNHPLSCREC